jgi:hypothetical protein
VRRAIRNHQEQDAVRAKHPAPGLDRAEGILAVFDEMAGDNKILRLIADLGQRFPAVDDSGSTMGSYAS